MWRILILFALACGDSPPAIDETTGLAPLGTHGATTPDLSLGSPGASVMRLLDQVADPAVSSLTVAASSVPDFGDQRDWALDDWRPARRPSIPTWTHALPIQLGQNRYTHRPSNLHLTTGGKAFPYQSGVGMSKRRKPDDPPQVWEVIDGRITLASTVNPASMSIRLVQSDASAVENRLNFQRSGLSPAAFVDLDITKGILTRRSLLLPAPGEAVFQVAIPEAAQLRFGFGLAEPDLRGIMATAQFTVNVNGSEVWSDTAKTNDDWKNTLIDLTPWAGQTISLAFRTAGAPDPERAYAAFANPEVVGPTTEDGPRRIVVIGLDTLRADHLGTHGYKRDTSPGLDLIAAQSLVFDNAWAPAPRTRPSFRSALTGRWPLQAIGAQSIGEVLRDDGFTTAGFVANIQLIPRLGFSRGFETWSYDNMQDADVQVDRTLAWLDAHQAEDAAVFLHLMDSHIFYLAPEPYRDRFTADFQRGTVGDRYNRWTIAGRNKAGKLTEDMKGFITARYDGEIAFLDAQIHRLVTAIDALPGRTLIVLHSDHGEEFWEHGGFEHNHSLYDELVRAVLWIRPPGGWRGGPHRVTHPASLVDIAPTVYSAAGITDDAPKMDGTDLTPLFNAETNDERLALTTKLDARALPLGHLMFDRERWGVVANSHKYILQTVSGKEELYDLIEDPGEQTNLAKEQDLTPWKARLSEATGWPVVTGWRVDVVDMDTQNTIVFEKPVTAAGVLDPEAGRRQRANPEWGEMPPVTPDDVASITLSEDRTRVHITPGPSPSGTLYIVGPSASDIARVTCERGESQLDPNGRSGMCGRPAQVHAGTIILPDINTAGPLRGKPDDDTIKALQTLGYVQ